MLRSRLHSRAALPASQLAATLLALAAGTSPAADVAFDIRFTPEVRHEPFTGRVYLFFSRTRREPRTGPDWFGPEPFVARDVADWKPGEPLIFSAADPDGLLAFPKPLSDLDLTGWRAQAVARFNPHERNVGTGPGNGVSVGAPIGDDDVSRPTRLTIDRTVPEPVFKETRWSKLLDVRSERLSRFHGRDVRLRAGVILPASYYDEPDRRYPTIYTIPGFGGTHFEAITNRPVEETNGLGVEFLRVVLDPSAPLGHHVFADSENNGPVGEALTRELIPAFDEQFRSVADPKARFLTGHSSGGWSSLWLQIAYPDQFGGTWSTSPDPVDFRDFQRINIYRPGENMYVDRDGKRRPLARGGNRVLIWYRDFAEMERVLGHGGQLHSFEAVFSPRGDDGRPRPLWERGTGAIDAETARAWERYDIRLVLERNWKTLSPKLRGKLHVFMGDADTFYLEGATRLLKESLADLGSDAVVELYPGKDHGTILTRELRQRLRREMALQYLKSFPNAR